MSNSATRTATQTPSLPPAVPSPPVWSCDTHRRSHYQQQQQQQQQRENKLKQEQTQLSTLLSELRRATNYWFQSKSDDGFQLLVQTCQQILQHGLRQPAGVGILRLIEDFEFLRHAEEQSVPLPCTSTQNVAAISVSDFLRQWITSCLRGRCLSRCMQSLVADRELLDGYYQRDVAYLRHSGYAAALFVCLTAIELDQSSLLSQLDPLNRRGRHRRTSSQPNFSIAHRLHVVHEEEQQQHPQQLQLQQQPQDDQLPHLNHPAASASHLLRRIKSLPCLYQGEPGSSGLMRPRCQTLSSRPVPFCSRGEVAAFSGSSISTTSSCSQTPPSPPRHIQLINCDDIKIWTDQTSPTTTPAKTPETTTTTPTAAATNNCIKRGSPFHRVLGNLFSSPPVYTSWYRRPIGQQDEASSVLDNFLPVNGRKLDKRQHQSLFEGISMLDDSYACQPEAGTSSSTQLATAPLDIVASQCQGQGSSANCSTTTSCSLSSDSQHSSAGNKIDNQSFAAFLQMSRYTHNNNTELEKENAHFRISEACIAAIEHVKWTRRGDQHNDSTANAAREADALLMPYVEQHNATSAGNINNNDNNHSSSGNNNNSNSAEAVGLQLISRFKDQQLPKLGDLRWLVSEQDAPQQLLPMPKPEAQYQQQQLLANDEAQAGLTRGTKTWAPPRQQIIFTEHPAESRSQLLQRQHYRCAGCGMHVTRQYQHHFRYCNYLGKYLCTGCHRNQLSAIPAKILQTWDFHSYAVSSFAYRLIEQMYTFPLFHVPDLNAQLYVKQKQLARARRRRQQLRFVRDLIVACRFATKEQAFFDAVPAHITNDPDMWSMCDFVDVQNKSMTRSIEQLIGLSEQHVYNCVLCTGRAFSCEHCKSRPLIYPWQRKVHRCAQCGACAHHNCWKSSSAGVCLRCQRLQERKQLAS
ncbi:GH11907 [Drosophila grimshawi]|uniref:GH11907 n=2 Tax=Drosophila grimshawi TaxID=7222 RepID=B4JLA4_DROGR|nr:GH11907 [Drosophila grimshawi]